MTRDSVSMTEFDTMNQIATANADPGRLTYRCLSDPNFGTYYAGAVSGLIARIGSPTSRTARQDIARLGLEMAEMMAREFATMKDVYQNMYDSAKQKKSNRSPVPVT